MALVGSESVQLINALTVIQNAKFASCKLEPTRWIVTGTDRDGLQLALWRYRYGSLRFLSLMKQNIYGGTWESEKNTGTRSDNLRITGVDLLSSNFCTYGRAISL
jgi:hypothetical protein